MGNESVLYFNLTMFIMIGNVRYLAFAFSLLTYAFIVCSNVAMIWIITQERSLHEPMYIFIAFLSVNSLYGSAGFFPRFLMDLLSDVHLISYAACYLQIYVIYTYASYEVTILSIMAYDRCIAVCQPLHYSRKLTPKTVCALSVFAWGFPAFNLSVTINMLARIPLCGNNVQKVYCASWNIVKLSCFYNFINNTVAMMWAVLLMSISSGFILYTYARIVIACWRKTLDVRGKVVQSCLPHLISFMVYIITSFSDTVLSRQNMEEINPFLAVILSIGFVIIPPALNPFIYGLKLPEIRSKLIRILRLKR